MLLLGTLVFVTSIFPNFRTLAFSKPHKNPNSPTLENVVGNVVEEILQERAEEVQREMVGEENQENAIEVVPEEIELVVDDGEVRAFYSHKGA